MIDIIYSERPVDELPYIEVHTYPSPLRPDISISSITGAESSDTGIVFTTFADRKEMDSKTAISEALLIAKANSLTKIYVRK